MYRPNSWEATVEQALLWSTGREGEAKRAEVVFEAGSDAMLEGLREEAGVTILTTETLTVPERLKSGYLVFIPEEG